MARAHRIAIMGQLTATIAHEISQPITAARNNASAALRFLARTPPDLEEAHEALACIAGDADRPARLSSGSAIRSKRRRHEARVST